MSFCIVPHHFKDRCIFVIDKQKKAKGIRPLSFSPNSFFRTPSQSCRLLISCSSKNRLRPNTVWQGGGGRDGGCLIRIGNATKPSVMTQQNANVRAHPAIYRNTQTIMRWLQRPSPQVTVKKENDD
ncbi:hypothetical protein CEXT_135491 [Caerostris extrusa]|uniref:Uncharacterized protein n=1 Tax=Caerostris extrusa TaxID=172846 RepID=A0AAV4UEM2_CAEEX|nr:hypothetical protein CEXT_135491 [Caerostris extrusa]